jgi:hypothetical protein
VFGSVAVGNTASSVLDIRGVYVDYGIPGGIIFGGLDPEDFNDPDSMPTQGLGLLGYGQCLAGPLGLGCGGTIIFKPTAAGTRTARIYINPNAYPAGIEYINVSGTAY